MDNILQTHVIEAGSLRADDFDRFFQTRAQALLNRIQLATGKSAEQLAGAAEPPEVAPVDYETPDEGEVDVAHGNDPLAGQFLEGASQLLADFEALQQNRRAAPALSDLLADFERVQSTAIQEKS